MVYNMKLVCGSQSVAGIKLTKRILVWGSGFIAFRPYALIRNDILCNIIIGGDYIILYCRVWHVASFRKFENMLNIKYAKTVE